MKIRQGFVSNSSSSSFIIPRRYVSEYQIERIEDHIPYKECERPDTCGQFSDGEYRGVCDSCDETRDRWHIAVNEDTVEGSTIVDNFDMHEFLESIGIPMNRVIWRE